jgi:6-phosphogluconolactonase (cycloisomerase 2 family)
MSTATVPTGNNPGLVTIDFTDQHAYVTNYNAGSAGTVWQYTVGVSGGLTLTSGPAVDTGKGPSLLALDGAGRYAYVPNIMDNTVSQYAVGNDGALTPLANPTVPTGVNPDEIAVTY